MAVVRRLNSFVFWLLFILFSTRCSLAYTLTATARESAAEETVLTEAGDVRLVTNIQKDNFEATLKESSFGKTGGRKMMNKKFFGKENVMHMNNQKEIIVAAEVTKISGANTVGNSSHAHKGKGKKIKVRKMRAKISTTSEPVEVKNGDLFAFSADYRKKLLQSENPLGTPEQHMLHEQGKTGLPKPQTRSSRKAYINTIDEYQHWKLVDKALDDKIMSLMSKDYPGEGNKPRHKPPINNNEPFYHPNVVP